LLIIDNNRIVAQRIAALRLSLQSDQSELIKRVEPLMYRRLRDRAKRQKQLFDLEIYAKSLNGVHLKDTFDAGLATSTMHLKVDGLMKLFMSFTTRTQSLDWAAKGLEELINRRISKNTDFYVRVEVIELSSDELARMSDKRRKKEEAHLTLGFTTVLKEEA